MIALLGILTGELNEIVKSTALYPGFVADLVTLTSVIKFGK